MYFLHFSVVVIWLCCSIWVEKAYTELAKKVVHDNGIKEFTIIREIKKHQCSCSCMCIPKAVLGDRDMSEFIPPTTWPTDVTRLPYEKRYTIVREIKRNKCNCQCTCIPDKVLHPKPGLLKTTTPTITRIQPSVVIDMVTKHMELATSTTTTRKTTPTKWTTKPVATSTPTATTTSISSTSESTSSKEQLSLNEVGLNHDEVPQFVKQTEERIPTQKSIEKISNDVSKVDANEVVEEEVDGHSPKSLKISIGPETTLKASFSTDDTSLIGSKTSPGSTTTQTVSTSRPNSTWTTKSLSSSLLPTSVVSTKNLKTTTTIPATMTNSRPETSTLTKSTTTQIYSKIKSAADNLTPKETSTTSYKETTGLRPMSFEEVKVESTAKTTLLVERTTMKASQKTTLTTPSIKIDVSTKSRKNGLQPIFVDDSAEKTNQSLNATIRTGKVSISPSTPFNGLRPIEGVSQPSRLIQKEDPRPTFLRTYPKGPVVSMQNSSEEKPSDDSIRLAFTNNFGNVNLLDETALEKHLLRTTQKVPHLNESKEWKILTVTDVPEIFTTQSDVELLLSSVKKDLQDLNERITTSRVTSTPSGPTTSTENIVIKELVQIRMNLGNLEDQIHGIRKDHDKTSTSEAAKTKPTDATSEKEMTTPSVDTIQIKTALAEIQKQLFDMKKQQELLRKQAATTTPISSAKTKATETMAPINPKKSSNSEESSKEMLKNLMKGLVFLKEKINQLAEEKVKQKEDEEEKKKLNLNKTSSTAKPDSTTIPILLTLGEANYKTTTKNSGDASSKFETSKVDHDLGSTTASSETTTTSNSTWTSTAIVQITNLTISNHSKTPKPTSQEVNEVKEIYRLSRIDQLPYLMELKRALEMLKKQIQDEKLSETKQTENSAENKTGHAAVNPEFKSKVHKLLNRIKEEIAMIKRKGVLTATTLRKLGPMANIGRMETPKTTSEKNLVKTISNTQSLTSSQTENSTTTIGSSKPTANETHTTTFTEVPTTIPTFSTSSMTTQTHTETPILLVTKTTEEPKTIPISTTSPPTSTSYTIERHITLPTTTLSTTTSTRTTPEPIVQLGSDTNPDPLHREEIESNIDSPVVIKHGKPVSSVVASGRAKIQGLSTEETPKVEIKHLFVQGKLPKNFVVVTAPEAEEVERTTAVSKESKTTTESDKNSDGVQRALTTEISNTSTPKTQFDEKTLETTTKNEHPKTETSTKLTWLKVTPTKKPDTSRVSSTTAITPKLATTTSNPIPESTREVTMNEGKIIRGLERVWAASSVKGIASTVTSRIDILPPTIVSKTTSKSTVVGKSMSTTQEAKIGEITLKGSYNITKKTTKSTSTKTTSAEGPAFVIETVNLPNTTVKLLRASETNNITQATTHVHIKIHTSDSNSTSTPSTINSSRISKTTQLPVIINLTPPGGSLPSVFIADEDPSTTTSNSGTVDSTTKEEITTLSSLLSRPPNVILPKFGASSEFLAPKTVEASTENSEELMMPKFIEFNPKNTSNTDSSPLTKINRLRHPEKLLLPALSTPSSENSAFKTSETESTSPLSTDVKDPEDMEIDADVMDTLQSSLSSKEAGIEKEIVAEHAIDSKPMGIKESMPARFEIFEPPKDPENILDNVAPMTPDDPQFMDKNNIAKRLEQARRLREEKLKLDMQESIQKEAEFRAYQERRRLVEAKLSQLAETERWQRELLQQAQLRQRAYANANADMTTGTSTTERSTTTTLPDTNDWIPITSSSIDSTQNHQKKTPKHCEPVQKFVQVFKVRDPIQWLKENCVFVKQYFPTASCSQIQEVLSSCFSVKDDGGIVLNVRSESED